jgi:tetratricopeptide (TPR) repeat protein
MKKLPEFQQTFSQLISKESIPEDKVNDLFVELKNFIYATEYERLSFSEKEQVQEIFDGVNNLATLNTDKELTIQGTNKQDIEQLNKHAESAEKLMDEAEEHFYAGRYVNAIEFYRKILEIEPTWLRAISHYEQAREYLRTGDIPTVALPSEVAINYGKAQSAFRVGRYKEALELLSNAKKSMAQAGIKKWKEGQDFEIHLEEFVQYEETAKAAVNSFNQGRVDDAILALDNVNSVTNIPRYKDLLDKYRYFKSAAQKISDTLNSPIETSFDEFTQADEALQKLNWEFEGNVVLKSLDARLAVRRPLIANSIRQEIRRLISEAEVAQTIDLAREYADKAERRLKDVGIVGLDIVFLNSVAKEINQLISEISGYQNELNRVEHLALDKANAKISKQGIVRLHQRFPNDPRIKKLQEQLGVGFTASPPPPDDDIDSIIQKAKDLFRQQKIDEAIEYLEYQYKITNAVKLRDIAEEYKEIRRIITNLNEVVYSGSVTEVIEISKLIIAMRDKHGDLPIPKSLLENLNDKLLIYLIDSKNEEKTEGASPEQASTEQGIAIQGLLSDQSSVSFHDYYRVLNGMILKDPLNQRVQILLSWVKHEIDLNEKQSRNHLERYKSIDPLRNQANGWYIVSIITAVAFSSLAFYIILMTINQDDVWVRLSSLLSILPALVSKLVYDQSLAANRRADEMYEKLMVEDARNFELDRLDEKDIRKKVFQEKSKPRQKKTNSDKNIPTS